MSWKLAADASPLERSAFASPEVAMSHPGEAVNDSKTNYTTRIQVGEKFYFIKRYLKPGKHLRRYLGYSRPAREWRNAHWFATHNVPFPRRVCFGEGNRLTGDYWGIVVFEEIAGSMDLRNIRRYRPELLAQQQWRFEVMTRLAEVLRSMHNQGFLHNDLNWRNLLVTLDTLTKPEVYLIDSPAGRRVYLLGNRRGIVRDLAFLDKLSKIALSNTDRLRFYKQYRGLERLRGRDKREIHRILTFLKNTG